LFRLTVTDDQGAKASDVVKVTVLAAEEAPVPLNNPPVADAGPDVTVTFPETTAELYGDFSHDADGIINNYSWRQISGDSTAAIADPLLAVTNLSNLVTGDYTFELTVTDDNGNSSMDSVTVSVVNNLRYENQMAIYPNPAKATISVQLSSDTTGPLHVSVYNASGIMVKSFVSDKTGIQFQKYLNISDLQAGLYYVEVIVGNKQKMISRFIKQQ
ncbi:MAG: T9SS type A sorting domain-containing protein, partial [Flavitalea sp.]